MDCNEFKEHIDDYIDGVLPEDIENAMETHANKCSECAKELEDMQKITEILHTMPEIPVPDDFLSNLNKRIDDEDIQIKKNRYKRFFNYRTYSAIAACLLCVAIVKSAPQLMSYLSPDNSGNSSVVITTPVPDNAVQDDTSASDNTSADSIADAQNTQIKLKANISVNNSVPTDTPVVANTDNAPVTANTDTTYEYKQTPSDTKSVAVPETTVTPTLSPVIINTPKPVAHDKENTPTANATQSSDDEYGITAFSVTEQELVYTQRNSGMGATKITGTQNTIYHINISEKYIDTVNDIITKCSGMQYENYYRFSAENSARFMNELDKNKIEYSKSVVSDAISDYIDILITYN